ncbi:dihydrofolate reductase family protein [Streptomyces lichenis]|uniref:Dihydrofolate reductase family protein n=1 Tax=Streptomyces lichenis TaxID=2306967 RepID=A0ABT0II52_9ACTN|nr:dihydrofolate reductase family protein [Streptomyces lichenis]MCK8680940.1 dihydrofolate reductase family protein [Streptomyces lichenis]
MRITVSEFISLDGVVQAPGGPGEDESGGFAHGGWSGPFFDPEVVGGAFDAALASADALLFGRRTWQTMAGAWPERAGDPFADRMNAIRKYVVSETLGDEGLSWENTVRLGGGKAADAVRGLAESGEEDGNLLVMGSPTLVRELLSADLVDELRLILTPVLLGGGKSIFPEDGGQRRWELVSSTASPTGTQVCVYRRAQEAGRG